MFTLHVSVTEFCLQPFWYESTAERTLFAGRICPNFVSTTLFTVFADIPVFTGLQKGLVLIMISSFHVCSGSAKFSICSASFVSILMLVLPSTLPS